jgi:hypothetical protein
LPISVPLFVWKFTSELLDLNAASLIWRLFVTLGVDLQRGRPSEMRSTVMGPGERRPAPPLLTRGNERHPAPWRDERVAILLFTTSSLLGSVNKSSSDTSEGRRGNAEVEAAERGWSK